MKIILNSGVEIAINNQPIIHKILSVLSGKAEPIEKIIVEKKSNGRKSKAIMGRKEWTENEEAVLKNLDKISSSQTLELGRQWGRTPRAIWQRYYKVKRMKVV